MISPPRGIALILALTLLGIEGVVAWSPPTGPPKPTSAVQKLLDAAIADKVPWKQGIPMLRVALSKARSLKDRCGEGWVLHWIGRSYAELGERENALKYYKLALPIRVEVGDREGEAFTLSDVALIYKSNSPSLAIWFEKRAVTLYESLRQDKVAPSKKPWKSYKNPVASAYRELAALLITQNRIPEGEQILKLLKDEEVYGLMSRAPVNLDVNSADPSAHLIAYYRAEGNADDSTGNHSGRLVNGVEFAPGVSGLAFQFDGSNQYVAVSNDQAWNFGDKPFTLSLWVNFGAIRHGPAGLLPNVFVGHDEGPGSRTQKVPVNKWVFFYDGNGKLMLHDINQALLDQGLGGVGFFASPKSFTPTIGTWHMYSLTRSGDTYTFYADGDSLGSTSIPFPISEANAPLTIGQAEGLGFLGGSVDDVRIYDDALNAVQIAVLFREANVNRGNLLNSIALRNP